MQTTDIYPVSDFNRKPSEHIKRIQETKNPEVLTVNGKAALVMIDPESFDQLRQDAELSRTLEEIAAAKAQIENGQYQSLDDAFDTLKTRMRVRFSGTDI
ncbi:type II toxin-antitoxin system Phd/YefM family antitoxin [Porticoccus sp. GXU_MW_L64]